MDRDELRRLVDRATKHVDAQPDWKKDILARSAKSTLTMPRVLETPTSQGKTIVTITVVRDGFGEIHGFYLDGRLCKRTESTVGFRDILAALGVKLEYIDDADAEWINGLDPRPDGGFLPDDMAAIVRGS